MAGAGQQVALQVFRPTTGVRNFFVNFAAPGRTVAMTQSVVVNGQIETRTTLVPQEGSSGTIQEDTSGEAASMLGEGGSGGGPAIIDQGGGIDGGMPQGGGQIGGESAEDLLNGG